MGIERDRRSAGEGLNSSLVVATIVYVLCMARVVGCPKGQSEVSVLCGCG